MESLVRYPRQMNINFRKLDKVALTRILTYYRVDLPRRDITQKELAIMVARSLLNRVFDTAAVAEIDVISEMADKHCYSAADSNVSKRRSAHSSSRDHLDKEPALPGEQVAAKVAREDGAWILGNVLDYNPMTQSYMVQDEDDVNRVLTMGFHDVRRLDDSSSHLRRGDQVLAVFPETTSFYNAVVVKTPKLQQQTNRSNSSSSLEVVVKFEDDEDENGRNPARRVPARFVLRRCDVEEDGNGDSDDDDG